MTISQKQKNLTPRGYYYVKEATPFKLVCLCWASGLREPNESLLSPKRESDEQRYFVIASHFRGISRENRYHFDGFFPEVDLPIPLKITLILLCE